MRKIIWKWIKVIFAKPYLLSLVVGFGLHFIIQISSWFFMNGNHFSMMLDDLMTNPFSGSIKILIPFTVPLWISRISRIIMDEREASILETFPALNPQPVLELDFNCRIIYINPAGERLLDKTLSDSENISHLLGPDFSSCSKEDFATGTFPPRIVDMGETVLLWNGSIVPASQQIHLFATDITSLQQAQLEIIHAREQAEEANHLKSVFMANISHEIRTPLTSIIGYAQLLELSLATFIGEEETEYFKLLYKGSDRLIHTLDKIVDISTIEAGLYIGESGVHRMGKLVQNIYSRFETAAREKSLTFELDIDLDADEVELDAKTVSKALFNLIDNAIKYTEKGGVWISMKNAQGSIRVDIRDSGIGIPPEFRNRVCEPFSQGSEGFRKDFQGIGLGLALAKRYLVMNHIEFELIDSNSAGTIFRLQIPLKADVTQQKSIISHRKPSQRASTDSSYHPGVLR